jgi:anti-sigma factor RsiW
MTEQLHVTDDDLVLHYYGEMPAGEEARTESHLAACETCQASYTQLQRVMAVVDSAPAIDAPEGFERLAWARLEPALGGPRRGWLSWFVLSPARLAFAAGVLILVGASFMAGRLMPRSAPAPLAGAGTASAKAADVREAVLLADVGEHLDRSQRMLVEVATADDSTGAVDMSSEQPRAEQLVAANRLYRQTAASTGDAAMASLLDDLERVLVDIAASPKEMTQEDFDSVRRRIDTKELLFKVRVMASQVRARQQEAIKVRSAQTTVGS